MYPSQQQAQPDAAAPAPSAHVQDLLQHGTTMAELKAAGKIPSAGNFGPVEGIDGNWRCTACNRNINFATRQQCNKCGAARPDAAELHAAHVLLEEQRNEDLAAGRVPRGFENTQLGGAGRLRPQAKTARDSRGVPIPGLDGNWRCTNCSTSNFADRELCHRCQTARPAADEIARQAHEAMCSMGAQAGAMGQMGRMGAMGAMGAGGMGAAAGMLGMCGGAMGLGAAGMAMGCDGVGGAAASLGADAGGGGLQLQRAVLEAQSSLLSLQNRQNNLELQVLTMQQQIEQVHALVQQQAAALGGSNAPPPGANGAPTLQ